jgi:hypothetical protein
MSKSSLRSEPKWLNEVVFRAGPAKHFVRQPIPVIRRISWMTIISHELFSTPNARRR